MPGPPIKPEAALLFACCRQRFEDAHRDAVLGLCRREEIDWETVFRAALAHGVAPLVGANLEACRSSGAPIPRDVLLRFQLATASNRVAKDRIGLAIAGLLEFCNGRALDVMLVKGAALDLSVYERDWSTISADVDLVFRPGFDEVVREDRRALHRLLGELAHRFGCAWECDWAAHHDITMNGILPVSFRRIWDDAVRVRYRERDAFVMRPEDALIAACIGCHRKRYLRLKNLCDVAEIVARSAGLDWDAVAGKSRAYDCGTIVYAALVATEGVLGLSIPCAAPGALGVGRARAGIIRHLFGRPDERILSRPMGREAEGVDWPLLKTYATFRLDQFWRNLRVVRSRRRRRRGTAAVADHGSRAPR